MISTVLVPTDFSDVANNALHFALKFAQKANAKVSVLHVTHIPVVDASFPAEVYETFMTEIEVTTKNNFKKLEETYLKNSGIDYEIFTVMGFVNDEVKEFAEKNNIDLIIMGTTGASGIKEVLVGSNASSVVARSHVPVLVIPPSSTYHDLKNIVYSSDYNEPEFPALSRLIYFAELYDATISVLHVKNEADKFFDSTNNFFVRNKHNISYEKIKMVKLAEGDVMDKINEFIVNEHADLLVMAKHDRTFFDRIFHRSLSKHMTYHTKIPLLVLNK
jgi:nucleotide-binding universal stress UspA family protein